MSFMPNSLHCTPELVSSNSNAKARKETLEKNKRRSMAQPIPVKLVTADIQVQPQQGLLLNTSTTFPATATKGNCSTQDSNIGGSNGVCAPFVPQPVSSSSVPLPPLSFPSSLFSSNDTPFMFSAQRPTASPAPVSSDMESSLNKAGSVSVTEETNGTTGIINLPHDNNNPLQTNIGIPSLAKNQHPSPFAKDVTQEHSITTALDATSQNDHHSKPTRVDQQETPDWLITLSQLKDQIQQIQKERAEERIAYWAKELERRQLERKMLNEIQKTGQQLALFSQQLQEKEQRELRQQLQKHCKHRSKSEEKQSRTVEHEKGRAKAPKVRQRRHSFSLSVVEAARLPSSVDEQQPLQSDYHSAMEDSDPDEKHSRSRQSIRSRRSQPIVSSLISFSSSSSLSSFSSSEDVCDRTSSSIKAEDTQDSDSFDSEHKRDEHLHDHDQHHHQYYPKRPHAPGPSSQQDIDQQQHGHQQHYHSQSPSPSLAASAILSTSHHHSSQHQTYYQYPHPSLFPMRVSSSANQRQSSQPPSSWPQMYPQQPHHQHITHPRQSMFTPNESRPTVYYDFAPPLPPLDRGSKNHLASDSSSQSLLPSSSTRPKRAPLSSSSSPTSAAAPLTQRQQQQIISHPLSVSQSAALPSSSSRYREHTTNHPPSSSISVPFQYHPFIPGHPSLLPPPPSSIFRYPLLFPPTSLSVGDNTGLY